jgi:sterol desaturase/sphingolipid hydroxylase (fatty acid hydroxylase superfamily)
MPTPLEILLDPISLIILALYAGMIIWEAVAPGRQLPRVSGWKLRGLAAFGVFFYLSSYLPLVWDGYFARFQLLDLSALGVVGGTLVGLSIYELGTYLWHRTMHKSDRLWLTFHQMHHSAERLDTFGTFFFSPFDMIGWTLLGSISLVLIVGLDPGAATAILLLTTWLAMFQHANVKTPRWLGYFIQRPESHTIHHAKGVHAYNYSDLPLWDILFGTFRNPSGYELETGFYDGASARIADMLLWRDVSEPNSEPATAVAAGQAVS